MPVEIRELVIQTKIISNKPKGEILDQEKLTLLKQKIIQECLKELQIQIPKKNFDR